MTGRHANRSGVLAFNFSTRPEEITLPRILQQAGYRTGHFGKWHIGAVKDESPVSPNRMGFDESLSHDNYFDMDPALSRNGAAPQMFKGERSEVLVDEALAFIRRAHREEKPFFVVIWHGSPHGPFVGLREVANAARCAIHHGNAASMDRNFRDHVVTAFRRVPLCGYMADTGTQLQNRLRSPCTLSTRPTGGQYFRRSIPATGNAASSRV